jgi:PIN domain nuclease of toxin-antitoxin system
LTILDAYAVLAFLKGESAAAEVEQLILAGGAAMTVLGVAEVLDHLIRRCDADEEDASLDVAQLGLDAAVGLDLAVAAAAGRLRARHYHRTTCPVSLADCVAAEAARSTQRKLATSDPSLLDVCHGERIGIVVLPGTDGSRWNAGRWR